MAIEIKNQIHHANVDELDELLFPLASNCASDGADSAGVDSSIVTILTASTLFAESGRLDGVQVYFWKNGTLWNLHWVDSSSGQQKALLLITPQHLITDEITMPLTSLVLTQAV